MKRSLVVSISVLFIISSFALPVIADSILVRFDGGIGSIPTRSGAADGTVRANDVLGINPGGRPWVIGDLRGFVKSSGRIRLSGKKLLLGGGGGIGTPATPRDVFVTLFCSNDGNIEHNSDPVPVEPDGDFRVNDMLSNNVPTYGCDDPVLLVRNFPSGSWFAAGIPVVNNRHDDDDDD